MMVSLCSDALFEECKVPVEIDEKKEIVRNVMEIFTDMPGMRIEIGDVIDNDPGRQSAIYKRNQGISFQTKYFSNDVSEQELEIRKVDTDRRFCSVTVFKFTVQ